MILQKVHIAERLSCAGTVPQKGTGNHTQLCKRREIVVDEADVRTRAEAHAAANVAGDLALAATDLTEEALANIGPVARRLPRPITSAEVTRVEKTTEDRFVSEIRYSGADSSVVVESVWMDREGRPMISETRII
jgi:hypothetical protein